LSKAAALVRKDTALGLKDLVSEQLLLLSDNILYRCLLLRLQNGSLLAGLSLNQIVHVILF
jgi:hypothetical protein